MQRSNISLIIIFSIIVLFSSCAKEGPTGPTGPAGPAYIGSISGHVSLYDQYGSRVLTNLKKVQLLLNSNYVVVSQDTAISPDNTGFYSYSNIATGEYYMSATDTGYGATVINNFQFLNGNLNKDIKLSAIPTFSLTFTSYAGVVSDSLVINCTPDPQVRNCIVFVNNSASIGNQPAYYLLSYVKSIPANASQVTMVINKQELYNTEVLATGSMAYYALYSYVVNDQSVYEDQTTGKNVYNAVSNPVIDSALVP